MSINLGILTNNSNPNETVNVSQTPAPTESAVVESEITQLPSNIVTPHPAFEFTPGIKKPEESEFKVGELAGAIYETSAWGLTQRLTEDVLRPDEPTPNYNVYQDIPAEFLNEQDIWYFLDSPNSIETAARANKLRREKNHQQFISNYPATYMTAAVVEGIVDPINWIFPGSKIAATTKQAYTAALAGKKLLTAKELAKVGAQSAALGAASGAVQESLIQATHVSRETSDSVYGVASNALISGVLGVAIPSALSGVMLRKAQSQVSNVLAGNNPAPIKAPTSKIYMMDMGEKAQMQGDDVFASLPKWAQKMANMSPAGQLRNSKSVSANIASSDIATTSLILNKNITKNRETQITVDEMISTQRGKARRTSADINKIFMEQQNISGTHFGGIRSRIAEAQGRGLGRVAFSEAMNEVMESGIPSGYPAVNKAAQRVKKYLDETKQELVELGLLDKKFLEPEFDNYWSRHWQETSIARNHEDFKLLMYKWFDEVNGYYKANQGVLGPLNNRLQFAEREYAKAQRNLKRVVKSEKYKEFKANKKKGEKHARAAHLRERIKKYKAEIRSRKEKLYSVIPKKYLTPGGFVPSGNKTPLELHAAAMQTFYRTTGSDVVMFMNPLISGGGNRAPDPLQARLLTIPWNYSISTFDGRTIKASDFFSRDVFKMIDNYSGQIASTMAFTRLAKSKGLANETELRGWYLNQIQADYEEMLKGVSGKKSLKMHREMKKDFKRVNDLFEQQYGLAGGTWDIFGPGWARFIRRLRQYNSERMLGSASVSSLTDPFVAPFRNGVGSYLEEYLVPYLRKSFTKGPNAIKLNKDDVRDAGFAIETQMGMIAKKFYDNDDLLIEQKWWQSIAEPAVNMFGNITGLSQLNDYSMATAGHISISKTLRSIVGKVEKGKLTKKNQVRLRNLTISPESEQHIYAMWKEKGGKYNGAYYSNHPQWNVNTEARAKAYQEFVNSWQKDVTHSTLISSKSEQPAWYQSTVGKVLFHFKDYLFAATQKLLMNGLQKIGQRDFEVVFSSMLLIASGMMTYIFNSFVKNPKKEIDMSFDKLLHEGIDRSALFGIWMEPINMFQKQGWLPGQSVSRYYSRGIMGNFFGPEIGVADELKDTLISPIVSKLKDESNYTTKDALQILRLIPFQNLFYLRYLNEQITINVAEELGATPKE